MKIAESPERLCEMMLPMWRNLLNLTELSIDDDFFDRGGDSLLATEFMLELRRRMGKAVPDSLLFECPTLRTLTERLSHSETPKPNFAVGVGAASVGATPLLFFHGDWTTGGFYVGHLAQKLGPRFSLIAVAAHGAADDPIPASIEAMAADRLPAILGAQPVGPYRLAGHCVGGIVALETARLLMGANRKVEAVAIIDPPMTAEGRSLRPAPAPVSGGAAGREFFARSDNIPAIPNDFEDDGQSMERYLDCLVQYVPTPLAVPLLVLSAEFDGRPWRELSADAELVEGGGAHFDWVTRRIDELAGRLSRFVGRSG